MKEYEGDVIHQKEFIEQLAEKYGYSKASAETLTLDFLNNLLDNIEHGNTIFFFGYGKLTVSRRKGRKGVKVMNGINQPKIKDIPDYFVLDFLPGAKLKIALKKWAATRERTEVGDG